MIVAHIGPASDAPLRHAFGGAVQRRMWELARAQVARGHRPIVYSFGPQAERQQEDGVDLRFIPCRSKPPLRQLEFQVRALRDLARNEGKIDVLHFHGQPEGAVLGRGKARATAISIDFFEYRGGRKGLFGPLYRKALQQFDLLLPCSEYCKGELARYWDLDPARLDVHHNGVRLDQFKAEPAKVAEERKRLGFAGPIFLYVGRVCEQKGSHVLLAAAKLVHQRRPDARLFVAGPVGQFGRKGDEGWTARIEEAGGTYLGAVAEERLPALMAAASVFVMPTVNYEMFGMAAVEAQACGVPVVASDHGGLKETVPFEVGGRAAVGQPAAFADEIVRLLGDEAARTKAAAAALHNAEQYSWPRIAESFDKILEARRAAMQGRG